jgi:CubicO group peptidase (beta-lactamase class C family)
MISVARATAFLFFMNLLFPLSAQNTNRIQEVENSLSPLVRLEGEALWTLEERMKHHHVPGLSIAVIDDYEIAWAKAYGYADAKEQTPVTTETVFQAASISKTINAVGLLKLVEKGRLDLTSDINDHLTSWQFPYEEETAGKTITLEHLLSHTAGLSTSGFKGYRNGKKLPGTRQIIDGEKPANSDPVRSIHTPGEQFSYSGGGITITQLLVEDISESSYGDYIHKVILQPLEMKNSFYGSPEDRKSVSWAKAHWADGKPLKGGFHLYPESAAAGLWTTPTDLARFIIALQKTMAGKSDILLSRESVQRMISPVVEEPIPVGLGVFLDDKKGNLYFQHSGSNEGFRCQFYGSVNDGKGVVVMVNSENFGIVGEVVRSVASVYNWENFYNATARKITSVTEEEIIPLTGTYELESGKQFSIENEQEQLFLVSSNGNRFPLYPESNRFFFLRVADQQFEFVEEEGGQSVKFYYNGEVLKAEKKE